MTAQKKKTTPQKEAAPAAKPVPPAEEKPKKDEDPIVEIHAASTEFKATVVGIANVGKEGPDQLKVLTVDPTSPKMKQAGNLKVALRTPVAYGQKVVVKVDLVKD